MLNIEETKEDHSEISHELQDSYVHAYQNASVYIPVEVTSRADSGEIKTSCCGEPTVAFHEDRRNGKYCFTIMQPICVEIPIEVSAEALLGKLYVNCGEEVDTGFEPDYEEKEIGREPVFEVTGEVSSPEPEQPKPSPTKYWYKVYF